MKAKKRKSKQKKVVKRAARKFVPLTDPAEPIFARGYKEDRRMVGVLLTEAPEKYPTQSILVRAGIKELYTKHQAAKK